MVNVLFVRSTYSLLKSTIKVETITKLAKAYGYKSLAISDFNNVHGFMAFKKACLKYQLKAIYAMEVSVNVDNHLYQLVLYPKNDAALTSLIGLSSKANLSKIDYNDIDDKLYKIIIPSDELTSVEDLSILKKYYNFHLGLVKNNYEGQKKKNDILKKYALDNHIKTLAYPKTYYLFDGDEDALRVLEAIDLKVKYNDLDLITKKGYYFFKPNDFDCYDQEDIINNEQFILDIDVSYNHIKTKLPIYQNNCKVDSKRYLNVLAFEGLKRRKKNSLNEVYLKRLKYELDVINAMDFTDYFLIVYDYVLYAKRHRIYVGPGRGSSAASLVCYCLGITDIDPISYNLIFERFLNPKRISMPDIDVDFPDDKRSIVIDYVKQKYGREHVAHIITYGTFKAKQVIRDVARVFQYEKVDILAKAIPNDMNITLKEAYQCSIQFKNLIENDSVAKKVYQYALKLEGLLRHLSTHAAGVVMSYHNLEKICPLIQLEEDIYTCAFTFEHLEEIGLIKMDFLGLKNLTIIDEISLEIKHIDPSFGIDRIDLNDIRTFELIKQVRTLGIFQLESIGMQKLTSKMKPNTFEELAMMIALFRPGPMENIDQFLFNRAHQTSIHYLHPDLKTILKETYGIIIYQEQIMMIARKLAGFDYAKADILRKAMSKKEYQLLKSLNQEFIEGSIKNGYDKDLANQVYEYILKFANYGFNKAHSIAYGKIAFEMAYLKANYPLFFYKALLNGAIGNVSRIYDYLLECKSVKLNIKNLSINRSLATFNIENDAIRLPLSIVKGIGFNSLNAIIKERNNHGIYKSYEDAIERLKVILNRNMIENLIKAGAFDEFSFNRLTMLYNLDIIYKKQPGYDILSKALGDNQLILKEVPSNLGMDAKNEKEVLGFNFSFNPLLEYKNRHHIITRSIKELSFVNGDIEGFGIVKSIRPFTTKNGSQMCFISVWDDTGEISLSIRPYLYQRMQIELNAAKNKYLHFFGKRNNDLISIDKLEIKE